MADVAYSVKEPFDRAHGPERANGLDASHASYQRECIARWETMASDPRFRPGLNSAYKKRLAQIFANIIPQHQRVLDIGCGTGDMLAALRPSEGVGADYSCAMIGHARHRHPELKFVETDAQDLSEIDGPFDFILASDLLEELWDVQSFLQGLHRLATRHTRLILTFRSRLWERPMPLTRMLGLASPIKDRSWLSLDDVADLLDLGDWEIVSHRQEILLPLPIPLVAGLCNRYLVKMWPFSVGAMMHVVVARPKPAPNGAEPVVSVIVPARNEAGNIPDIMKRVPEMGAGTEIIFIEGHSKDNTYDAIEKAIAEHPERRCKLLRQAGEGKGDAVRLGFSVASGDFLMILDADLTVPPETLPRFYEAWLCDKGEFINGVRLVYPMEGEAMRFWNLVANKFFSVAFSLLLGQPVKDTLCGTKCLSKADYAIIAANRSYFGDFDPFGDFDLLFGAAKLNLKIIDMPVRYRARTYGTTNIRRWRHGWLLLKMLLFAARRLKFI